MTSHAGGVSVAVAVLLTVACTCDRGQVPADAKPAASFPGRKGPRPGPVPRLYASNRLRSLKQAPEAAKKRVLSIAARSEGERLRRAALSDCADQECLQSRCAKGCRTLVMSGGIAETKQREKEAYLRCYARCAFDE